MYTQQKIKKHIVWTNRNLLVTYQIDGNSTVRVWSSVHQKYSLLQIAEFGAIRAPNHLFTVYQQNSKFKVCLHKRKTAHVHQDKIYVHASGRFMRTAKVYYNKFILYFMFSENFVSHHLRTKSYFPDVYAEWTSICKQMRNSILLLDRVINRLIVFTSD